jgi:hypothetical protein
VERPEERDALQRRLEKARRRADGAGTRPLLDALERRAEASQAVLCKHVSEVQRLASSEKQGIATYYQAIEAEARLPDGDEWDVLRRQADAALFPGYERNIRFAALSLDRTGVRNYGACSMTLRADYIAHRSTVFEENSAVFVKRFQVGKLQKALLGQRASWKDRGKLAVAKLGAGSQLGPSTQETDLPGLFLRQGATSADDDFIEVHVHGPMSIRTFEHVEIRPRPGDRRLAKADLDALDDALGRFGVKLDVIP